MTIQGGRARQADGPRGGAALSRLPSSACLADEDAVWVQRLADSSSFAAMRRAHSVPKSLVDRLPKLKLLITTVMRNASFDMAALKDRGVHRVRTAVAGAAEDTADSLGLILGAVPAQLAE